jgi:hypothetical protein
MPGKLYMGLDAISVGTQSDKIKVARSYCEGRKASADGELITTNPHSDPKGEAFVSWDQGWTDEDGGLVDVSLTGCAV